MENESAAKLFELLKSKNNLYLISEHLSVQKKSTNHTFIFQKYHGEI